MLVIDSWAFWGEFSSGANRHVSFHPFSSTSFSFPHPPREKPPSQLTGAQKRGENPRVGRQKRRRLWSKQKKIFSRFSVLEKQRSTPKTRKKALAKFVRIFRADFFSPFLHAKCDILRTLWGAGFWRRSYCGYFRV